MEVTLQCKPHRECLGDVDWLLTQLIPMHLLQKEQARKEGGCLRDDGPTWPHSVSF